MANIKVPINIRLFIKNFDTLTASDKKFMMDTFWVYYDRKETKLGDNYVDVVTYERKYRVYNKSHPLFNEFHDLPLGMNNWYDSLSFLAKKWLLACCTKRFLKEADDYAKRNKTNEDDEIIKPKNDYQLIRELDYFDRKVNDRFLELSDEDYVELLNAFLYDDKISFNKEERINEIYSYALMEKCDDWFKDDGKLREDIIEYFLENKLPMTTKDKIKFSCNRTYKKLIELNKANADKFKYFVTLTFADIKDKETHIKLNQNRNYNDVNLEFTYVENVTSLEYCNEKLDNFIGNFKRDLKKKEIDLYYLGVPEYQKNGSVHYHFLMSDIPDEFKYNIPAWLDFDYNTHKLRKGKGLKNWVYGKSDIEYIANQSRVSTYISKYILKNIVSLDETVFYERLNKKRYFASRNLVKPEVKYNYDSGIDIDSSVDYYQSVVKNHYDGLNIVKESFQIKNLK